MQRNKRQIAYVVLEQKSSSSTTGKRRQSKGNDENIDPDEQVVYPSRKRLSASRIISYRELDSDSDFETAEMRTPRKIINKKDNVGKSTSSEEDDDSASNFSSDFSPSSSDSDDDATASDSSSALSDASQNLPVDIGDGVPTVHSNNGIVMQLDQSITMESQLPPAIAEESEFEDTAPVRTPVRRGGSNRRRSGERLETIQSTPRATSGGSASRPKKLSAKERADRNLLEWHPELNIDWEALSEANKKRMQELAEEDQPEELVNVKLLPYQRESLAWFRQQEQSEFNGGILADEMGMGKTLQMITLLIDRPIAAPTLVVCPVVAMIQWREEIERYTPPDKLRVLLFHGANRTADQAELCSYDVVLTSYAVVESCYRKQQSGFQRKNGKVYEKSLLHGIQWGRIILDEAHNIKDRSCSTARSVFNLRSDKKWSLSGTPLQNRVGELYSLIRFLQVSPYSSYYCTKCPCKTSSWQFSDNSHCDSCGHKPMQHFCWWNRTILKPIQRYGGEGDGRIAFERLVVLLDQMMLRRTKIERADDLGLPPRLVEIRRDYFNEKELDFYRALYSETRTRFASYVRTGTVLNNFAHIFELLSKLRQAADHPFLVVHKRPTGENPGAYVCGLCHEVAEEPIASRCKHVFCREDIRQYMDSYWEDERTAECPVCFTRLTINLDQDELPPPDQLSSSRDDRHCSSIVNRMLNSSSLSSSTEMGTSVGSASRWTSSTKIEALLEELNQIRQSDHTVKSIVFSQFVSFLDLVYWRLRKAGYHCVKLDGRMTPEQRDSVIKTFMTVPQVTVFLVSLKAGGVALNLTEASRIFIMDCWWNPAVEDQAMDRIHRLGQYRAVRITRMVIEDSIESRIIQLQEKKKLLFQSTVGKDAAALERLTEEDLHFLFQM